MSERRKKIVKFDFDEPIIPMTDEEIDMIEDGPLPPFSSPDAPARRRGGRGDEMSEATSERLAKALEAKNDPLLAGIIVRARRKYYDEYEGELATPLMQLVADLKAVGHREFSQRVINGDFDATKAESDAWFEREGRALVKGTPLERIFKK